MELFCETCGCNTPHEKAYGAMSDYIVCQCCGNIYDDTQSKEDGDE